MKSILEKVNQYIEQQLLNYIDRVTGTLYPKQKEIEAEYKEDDDDEDPILFI